MSTPIVPNSASFLITDVGLAAASVATPTGPSIQIVAFKVGDGYGYTPQRTDTGLNGNTLYTGVPTTYNFVAPDTLDILCELPPDAGYFEFGEVGLYLPGDVLFAKAVFQKPQLKYPNMTAATVNTYSLHCLLKLQQAMALIQVTVQQNPAILNVYAWSDVIPPNQMMNPFVPALLVHENNADAEPTLMTQVSTTQWAVASAHYKYATNRQTDGGYGSQLWFPIAASSSTWIEVNAQYMHSIDLTVGNRIMIVQTPEGYYRSVQSITQNGSNYRLNLNCTNDGSYNNKPLPVVPSVGQNIRLYRDDFAPVNVFYSQIVDPPALPLASAGVPGLATSGDGTTISSPGHISAYGLLHEPSANTGRFLTNSDDLNNLAFPSGLYTCYWNGPFGNPHNTPADQGIPGTGTSFHLMQICPERGGGTGGGSVTQMWYPIGQGDGGPPVCWRVCSSGSWGPWYQLSIIGKAGGGMSLNVIDNSITSGTGTFTWTGSSAPAGFGQPLTKSGFMHLWVIDDNANTTTVRHNGNIVSENTKNGGSGYGRRHHD
ncbi:TPA: phage tail protein, partial [Escherichia coli]|nr:phage tail protein [Escherichia coli]